MRACVDNVTLDSRGQALQVRGLLIGIDCVANNVNDLICVGAVNMETQVAEAADIAAGVPHSLPVYQDTYDNVIGFRSPLTTTLYVETVGKSAGQHPLHGDAASALGHKGDAVRFHDRPGRCGPAGRGALFPPPAVPPYMVRLPHDDVRQARRTSTEPGRGQSTAKSMTGPLRSPPTALLRTFGAFRCNHGIRPAAKEARTPETPAGGLDSVGCIRRAGGDPAP